MESAAGVIPIRSGGGAEQRFRGGTIAGAIAACVMILARGIARVATGVPMFPPAILWVMTGLVVLPVAGPGLFKAQVTIGVIGLNMPLLIGFAHFGLMSVATLATSGVDIDDGYAIPRVGPGHLPRTAIVRLID